MPEAHQFADQRPAKQAHCKTANGKTSARRLAWTLLLIMGAAAIRPSSRLLAQAPANGSPQPTHQPTLRPAAEADIPFADYDSAAEEMLLDLANQARSEVGAPALKLDSGLSQAARAHAQAMLAANQLSHQLEGEPSLSQRLLAAVRIQLDQEAENVALDYDPEDGHKHLMLSPPHRANLLNPAYNVIGIGVVHAADRLYIVQDFGHALPAYSAAEFKNQIAAAVSLARHHAKQPALARLDFLSKDSLSKGVPSADDAACSMAQADKLITPPIRQLAKRYTVASYTSLQPDALPANSAKFLSTPNLRSFSVGTCYARTQSYPMGVYWILLAFE